MKIQFGSKVYCLAMLVEKFHAEKQVNIKNKLQLDYELCRSMFVKGEK